MKRFMIVILSLFALSLGGCDWFDDDDGGKSSMDDSSNEDPSISLTALVDDLLLDTDDTSEPSLINELEIYDDAENQERAFDQHL